MRFDARLVMPDDSPEIFDSRLATQCRVTSASACREAALGLMRIISFTREAMNGR